MALSATLATFLLITVSTVFATNSTKSAETTLKAAAYSSSYTTSRYSSSSTTPRHHIGHTYYYYMDSSYYCSAYTSYRTIDFSTWNDDAYVKAWTYSRYTLPPTGSCSYTVSSYFADDLKFKFKSLQIGDCSVKVKVYRGSTTIGSPDVRLCARSRPRKFL